MPLPLAPDANALDASNATLLQGIKSVQLSAARVEQIAAAIGPTAPHQPNLTPDQAYDALVASLRETAALMRAHQTLRRKAG